MNIRQFAIILPLAAMALCALSCTKDPIDNSGGLYVEGRKTCISLHIGMPAMSVATRADMPEGTDSQVNSLWVGIFSAKDGSCTYAGFPDETPKLHGEFITLSGIETLSGKSYIVAVANPVDNFGYLFNPENPTSSLAPTALDELLPKSAEEAQEKGFTWDSYCNLAIHQLELRDVNVPMGNLVMSGIYYDNEADPSVASDWEQANQTPVDIPASQDVELEGAIHLRRLISQVTFNLQAVDYTQTDSENPKSGKRIVEIIPQSYQVRNVPYTSWLHERVAPGSPDEVTTIQDANSGDVIRVSSITYNDGDMALRSNYRNSAWFSGNQYITANYKIDNETNQQTKEVESYTFDFWMLENKRWAAYDLESKYDLREKEIKETPDNDPDAELNTGIYTALCGESGTETMNNCATFVEIRCRILYTEEGLDAVKNDPDYQGVEYRTAEAIYTVHLGGIDQNWNDFTHRRNHRYTYNITVMDIDRILVEAKRDDETRPGIEGVVTDVMNAPFEIDCHYAVFNIQLSNAERTGRLRIDGSIYDQDVFPFRIRYYDENDLAHYIDQDNVTGYMGDPTKELYWTWVEFRPTTGEEFIADYKPYKKEDETDEIKRANADGLTFRLNQVADLENFPGAKNSDETDEQYEARKNDPEDTTPRWYTVFVNEYVYETSPNEDTDDSGASINNWTKYVNLSPRICWLNTLANSSSDGESNYIRSKYAIRQQSIQTFYALPDGHTGDAVDAIGMEHLNETFGFNLRWDDVTTTYGNYEFDETNRVSHTIKNNNGRHNTLLYIAAEPQTDGTGFSNGGLKDRSAYRLWNQYVNPNALQYVTDFNDNANQNYKENIPDENTPFYLPTARTYTTPSKGGDLGSSNINKQYYLRILDACMNRNRDNNGNGVIDIEELRWYVPGSSEIVELVLGRNSLVTPLMDYSVNFNIDNPTRDVKTEEPHQSNTRFHYATSNQRVLWAEEGTSINPETDEAYYHGDWGKWDWNLPPQQVRCVRALGTNLTTDTNNDLSPAFTTDAEYTVNEATGERMYTKYPTKIFPTYYEQKNQRPYTQTLDPHQEVTTNNRLCYSGFEFEPELYSFERRTITITETRTETIPAHWEFPAGYYLDPDGTYLGANESEAKSKALELLGIQYYEERHSGEEHKEGWYLPDSSTYSDTEVPGSYWWDNGFYGGNIHSEQTGEGGSYLPDKSTYMEYISDEEKNTKYKYWFYWEEFTRNGVHYEAGWYRPDPSTMTWWDSDMTGYKSGCVPFYDGDYYPPGWYQPDLTTWSDHNNTNKSDAFKHFDTFWDETYPGGYYTSDGEYYAANESEAKDKVWAEISTIYEQDGRGEFYPEETKTVEVTREKTLGQWRISPETNETSTEFAYDNRDTFIEDHGITLDEANRICQEKQREKNKGTGWRLPNMKEAALIKVALERAGMYKQTNFTGGTYWTPFDYQRDGIKYQIGNFLTSTYREFGIVNGDRNDQTGFYTGVYYPESSEEVSDSDYFDDAKQWLMGRIACITTGYYHHFYIRCVRDLQ